MNWKKQFDEVFSLTEDIVTNGAIINKHNFKDALRVFIATEIIEKLIEETDDLRDAIRSCSSPNIPAKSPAEHLKWAKLIQRIDALDKVDSFKQQRKDKWL